MLIKRHDQHKVLIFEIRNSVSMVLIITTSKLIIYQCLFKIEVYATLTMKVVCMNKINKSN